MTVIASLSRFLAMGGYAAYVWPAYGITAMVLTGNWWLARRRHASLLKQLAKRPAGSARQ